MKRKDNMKFTLKQPLPFINKENITFGYIEKEPGKAAVLKSGTYTQVLKERHYRELLTAAGLNDELPDVEPEEVEEEVSEIQEVSTVTVNDKSPVHHRKTFKRK